MSIWARAGKLIRNATLWLFSNSTFWLFIWLVMSTAAFLFVASVAVGKVQDVLQEPLRVHVGNLGALPLSDTPPAFFYDRRRGELVYAGPVSDDAKRTLVAAVRDAPAQLSAERNTYLAGVDRLAFDFTNRLGSLVLALLFLGGMAGALGVQLRSIANFVGHTCYKRDLDVSVWWPYYFIRPMTGFLLGTVLVGVVQAGLFSFENSDPGKVMWWAALAFLAGFGEDEFTQRLRSVSQTLFGNDQRNDPKKVAIRARRRPKKATAPVRPRQR